MAFESKQHSDQDQPQVEAYQLPVTPLTSRVLVLVLAFLLTGLLLLLITNPLTILEERLGSAYWQLNPDTTPEQRLVIVTIDEASLQQYGPWPWPRPLLTQLSDQLATQGARLQIFDLVLPESKAGDLGLSQSLQHNRAILAQVPLESTSQHTGTPAGSLVATACGPSPVATGFLANHHQFSPIAAGHIAATADSDGSIRFQPLGYCYQGQLYPSLALASYQALFHIDGLEWQTASRSNSLLAHLLQAPYRLQAPDYPLLNIPVNDQGQMRIDYRKSPDSFIYISAADLLAQRVPPSLIDNKLVLIGATAFGLGDIVPTPHSGVAPGVELQARLIASLLDNTVPYTPKSQGAYQFAGQLLTALILLLLAQAVGQQRHRLARIVLLSAPVTLPALFLFAHIVGLHHQLWLGWLPQGLFAISAALLLASLEFLRNRHERQRLYDNLSRYLPIGIARQTALMRPNNQIEVRQQRAIVLSADLRNFSACQQHLSAEEGAQLLHQFFTQAGVIIEQNNGTLYELHADSLLAIWLLDDAPVDQVQDTQAPTSQEQAANTAQQLYQQLQPLLNQPLPEPLSPLDLGIGLAAGRITAGSLGCAGLRTHMLMGETVTIALRLQQMTQELASPILLDTSIARLLPAQNSKSLGRYLLEGLTRPREVFALPYTGSFHTNVHTSSAPPHANSKVTPLYPERQLKH